MGKGGSAGPTYVGKAARPLPERSALSIVGGVVELMPNRIVAVGLLTQQDLDLLGQSFDRLWPVDDAPCFIDLLEAIDEADRALQAESKSGPVPT